MAIQYLNHIINTWINSPLGAKRPHQGSEGAEHPVETLGEGIFDSQWSLWLAPSVRGGSSVGVNPPPTRF